MIHWQTIVVAILVPAVAQWVGTRAGKRAYRKAQEREYRNFNYRHSDVPLTRKEAKAVARTAKAIETIQKAIAEEAAKPYSKPLTVGDKRQIEQIMDNLVEKYPDSPMFQQHPEFVESYLSKIDISHPDILPPTTK